MGQGCWAKACTPPPQNTRSMLPLPQHTHTRYCSNKAASLPRNNNYYTRGVDRAKLLSFHIFVSEGTHEWVMLFHKLSIPPSQVFTVFFLWGVDAPPLCKFQFSYIPPPPKFPMTLCGVWIFSETFSLYNANLRLCFGEQNCDIYMQWNFALFFNILHTTRNYSKTKWKLILYYWKLFFSG